MTDSTPVQTRLPLKASSPDALRVSTASLATVSNINIDVQLQPDKDAIKRQVEEPQSVVSVPQAVNESQIKTGRKPDPSPSRSPAELPPKSVAGGEQRRESNGSLHIHQPDTESPGETVSVCRDNQETDVDDTLRLLKEADMHDAKLEIRNDIKVFSVSEKKPQYKSRGENSKVFRDVENNNNNDTVTLLKGAVLQHQSSDVQVSTPTERLTLLQRLFGIMTSNVLFLSSQESLESTEKLLEPLPTTVVSFSVFILMLCIQNKAYNLTVLQEVVEVTMLFQEESPLPVSEPAVTTPPVSSEPFVSQQHRVGDTRRAHGTQEKVTFPSAWCWYV